MNKRSTTPLFILTVDLPRRLLGPLNASRGFLKKTLYHLDFSPVLCYTEIQTKIHTERKVSFHEIRPHHIQDRHGPLLLPHHGKKGVDEVMGMLDYRTIGGTEFLGIRKPVIKAHGSSDALAFRNAVLQAQRAAGQDISAELEEGLRLLSAQKENADA